MPIQPKFQIGRKERKYFATKQFTDRNIPRELFLHKVNAIKNRTAEEANHDVIMYYGVGGIGKSSLQKQLKIELLENDPNALYTAIDFKDSNFHTPARALLELVREVTFKHKITFPHFEIAYSIYFYKRNPDITFNEKKLPFEKELGILGDVISVLDGMGIAGTISGIVGKVYDTKKNWNLNKEVKGHLKDLENLTVQEIEEQLVAFFAYDIQKAIEKHLIPSTVIFLDTFEALWSGLSNKATVHTKDKWVRDLIGSLPNVLFVICGREYLEWEKYDSDWKDILDHHIIENLDHHDAAHFLENCGVAEEAIRNKMISSSSGHPYHLDLSVDTYFEMKNRGEAIHVENFGSNQREILDRFLQYLTDEEIETLKIMSIPRFYNKEIFAHLIAEHPTGYPVTKYDDFNKFSFITKENDKLFIHALMRQGMLDYTSKDLDEHVHQTMAEHYDEKFTEYAATTINKEKEVQVLGESIFHRKAFMKQDAFIHWLSHDCLPTLQKLQLRGESRFLRETLGNLYEDLGARDLGISLLQILIDMVHLNGEYKRAIAMIDDYFSGTNRLESKQAAHLAIRKVHHQMFFMPVDPLIQELLQLEADLRAKNWPAQYNELLFMLGGNLGVLSGDLTFSRKWLIKSIRHAEQTEQNNYLCRSLRKYTDILKEYGHLSWARAFCEKGIEVARNSGYERYEAILICTLGDIYRMEKKYEVAEDLFEKAMKMIKKVGIKGWEGHIHSSYAELNYQKGDYQGSVNKYQEALEIYKNIQQKWGLIQANIGLERCKLKGVTVESEHPFDYWKNEAKRLKYRREQRLIEETISGETSIVPLIFL
ncbi:tetratricopeptide repeat protein [Virgibacillus byunsanensis]|uniref:Tetratricopeptide repeat protein n=1 Tax=Virgibacillus byunsanensis TaxID=570945 RepID=A0ABW3LJL1_9BACI